MKNKKVLVIGMGESGKSARDLLLSKGAEVHAYDGNPAQGFPPPKEVAAFDLAVVSPGVPEKDPVFCEVLREKIPWMGEVEFALQYLPGYTVIGITGTNGKTTVTSLVAHALKEAGIAAHPLGNIGIPLSAFALAPKEGILVVELSSYQIDGMFTRTLDVAVILNITPDHLDRYGSMEAYAASKKRIALLAKEGAYVNLEGFPGRNFEEQNKEAARRILSRYGVTDEVFENACAKFRKPPHRLAFVAEVNGVSFYNDSKGTNLDAVSKAVESFDAPVILIAGGKDKGGDYKEWIAPFRNKVRAIFLIGEAAKKIDLALRDHYPTFHAETLERATREAFSYSQKGDIVLLSPGCSSFDQFKNYEDRGKRFEQAVIQIDNKG